MKNSGSSTPNSSSWFYDTISYYTGYGTPPTNQQDQVDPNEKVNYWLDEKKRITLFHDFAQRGDLESLTSLISEIQDDTVRNHPSLNNTLGQKDTNGYTPLHLACKYGHKNIIICLLPHMQAKDIQATTEDKDGYNALHFVCSNMNDPDVIELLLLAGGNMSFRDDTKGDKKVFTAATNGFTPLHCAAAGGKDQMVKYLLPLMRPEDVTAYTVSQSSIKTHLVLDYKVAGTTDIKPNHIEKCGFSPLHLAAKEGHLPVVNILLDYYSSLKAESTLPKPTTDIGSYSEGGYQSTTVLKKIANYSEQQTKDGNKHTALHLTARGGFPDIVEALLKHNQNLITILDKAKNNPLHLASNIEVMSKLTPSPMYFAALNVRNKDGNSSLHCAVKANKLEVVQVLLQTMENHPQLIQQHYLPNNYGQTPLHLATNDSLALSLLNNLQYHQIDFFNAVQKPKKAIKIEDGLKVTKKSLNIADTHEQEDPTYNATNTKDSSIIHVDVGKKKLEKAVTTKKQPLYNTIDTEGNNILHCVSYYGLDGALKLTLSKLSGELRDEYVNKVNKNNCAPIHLAKNDAVALLLLDETTNRIITSPVYHTKTKLFETKKYCNETAITFTPESTRRKKNPDEKATFLHIAIKKDLTQTVTKLLSKEEEVTKPLINSLDAHNNTPFHLVSSDAMGQLLLPHITKEHISKVNKGGQTILHIAVQKNLCTKALTGDKQETHFSFIEGLIKKEPHLLSIQNTKGAFPTDLANTPEMARFLAQHCSKELLIKIITNCKGDWTQGIGLIISELSPDVLKAALASSQCNKKAKDSTSSSFSGQTDEIEGLTSPSNAGVGSLASKANASTSSSFSEQTDEIEEFISQDQIDDNIKKPKSLKQADDDSLTDSDSDSSWSPKNKCNTKEKSLPSHLKKELAKTDNTLKRMELGNEWEDLGQKKIEENIDPNIVLLQYTNLLYALGNENNSIKNYIKLFSQAPQHIAEVLGHLSDSDIPYIQKLLASMKPKQCGPWNKNQIPNEVKDNLLYKFVVENKENIAISLFKAEISADYFDQALRYAIDKKEEKVIDGLLKSLAASVKGDHTLWQLPATFLCKAIDTDDHTLVDIFLQYVPDEVVNPASSNLKLLYHAQREEMVRKLIGKYPDLKTDDQLDQGLDSDQHCIPLIANYNIKGQTTPDSIVLHRKGYILELLDRKQQALECFSAAKKHFPEYQHKPQKPLEYSNEVVRKLIEAQIDNKTTIVEVMELSSFGNQVESNFQNHPTFSQAIALKLPQDYWVNIFIRPENDKIKMVCTHTKNASSLVGVVQLIQKYFTTDNPLELTTIILNQSEQDGLPTSVVENLARIAGHKEELTKLGVTEILAKQASKEELSITHLLMLESECFYSDTKLGKLLTILLPKICIAPVTDLHNQQGLAIAINLVTKEVLEEKTQAAVIPFHSNEKHWSSLVIKRDEHGGLFVIYSDATGNPLTSETNADTIISSILHLSSKTTFIDSQRQQIKFNDNGAWTIENIVSLVQGKPLQEFDQKAAGDKHLQLLRENRIPVPDIGEEDIQLLPPCFPKVKSYDECFAVGRNAYEVGKIKESLNYYAKAVKFCDQPFLPLEIERAKFKYLPEKACSTIFTTLDQSVESYKNSTNENNFSVVALKSESSYAALLIGYKQDILQMIHFDSAGVLLTDKEGIVSIIKELMGVIPLSIVDIANKVKETTVECFEAALTQLEQINCEPSEFTRVHLQKQLADYLECNITGNSDEF